MDEYINLQTAKENIVSLTTYNGEEEIRQAVKSARYKEDQWIGGIYDALISLSEIPAADVKPNIKGYWIKTGQSFIYPDKFICYSCSECGYDIEKTKFNYCPNCGAKMEGER